MPFAPHSRLVTPPEETIIWRYMSLAKLDSLLSCGLWFCRADRFDDPCEGAVPLSNWQAARDPSLSLEQQVQIQRMLHNFEEYRVRSYVSCWNMSECESTLRWNAYQADVVIRSTVGRLKRSLGEVADDVHITQVGYHDLSQGYFGRPDSLVLNAFDLVVNKETAWDWEEEVRAIILNPIQTQGEPHPPGVARQVDFRELIAEIRFAAATPISKLDEYRSILTSRVGPQLILGCSDVGTSPQRITDD